VGKLRHLVALATVLVALGSAHAATAATTPLPPVTPRDAIRVSDEKQVTRWGYVAHVQSVRARPSNRAHRVAKLHIYTEDDFPEIYVVLQRWTATDGTRWLHIRVPMRPNGRTGWVHESALTDLVTVRTALRIDRRHQRLTLFKNGRAIFRTRVGVGKPSTPTPHGHFYIREKFRVVGAPLYGPFAMGTSAYAPHLTDWPGGGVVGLHGTDQPSLIPGRPSHGCIRLRNGAITKLYRLVPRGTPVDIV
jgi:lipoprotein-anchoring transpeptidase ErfK/SrfK